MVKYQADEARFENVNPSGAAFTATVIVDEVRVAVPTQDEGRISLAPLDPADALRAMLSTPPATDR